MKKIIISLTLISFFNFIGCSSIQHTFFTANEYVDYEKENGKPKEIWVFTNDTLTYHFADWGYNVVNDTLKGKGTQVVDGDEVPYQGSIPLQDISEIETTDQGYGTVYTIIGAVLGALMAGFWIWWGEENKN